MFVAEPTRAIVRHEARLDWRDLPAGYRCVSSSILHEAHLLSGQEGLALGVCWHENGVLPPLVGLARTCDAGHVWRVSRTWQGPVLGDPNERHVLVLEVG